MNSIQELMIGQASSVIDDLVGVIEYSATGSRAYGFCEITEATDHDYIILVEDIDLSFIQDLVRKGFSNCSTVKSDYACDGDDWYITRRNTDNINLIITTDREKYDVWMRCHDVTSKLRLEKPARRYLFEIMLNRVVRDATQRDEYFAKVCGEQS